MALDKEQEKVIFDMALTLALAETPKTVTVMALTYAITTVEDNIRMIRLVDEAYEEALR